MTNVSQQKRRHGLGELVLFLRPYYLPVLLSLLFTAAATVLSILAPQVLSKLVNVITASFGGSPVDMGALAKFAVILMIFYACNALCTYVSSFLMTTVSQKACKGLRAEITAKINRVPLRYFDAHPYGDTLSIVTNDVDTIGNSLQQSVSMAVQSVCMLVGVLIAMFVTSWQLALTVLLIVPFMAVLMFVIMRFSQPQFKKLQNELAELNGKVEETYSGQLVVKAFNAEAERREDFEKTNRRLRRSTFLSQALSGAMQPAMTFVSYFAYAAVCVVAGLMIAEGSADYGMLSAFLVYVNLFQSPLSQIAQAFNVLQSAAAASTRVFGFLNEEELSDESGKVRQLTGGVRGEVEFRHVRFGYDESRIIIPDFSAKVQPGWKVAIVGPTGAGKTTMVNLLMRFYEMDGGDILIDGVSVKDMPREEIHDLFGMVLQDTWMFEGTLLRRTAEGGVRGGGDLPLRRHTAGRARPLRGKSRRDLRRAETADHHCPRHGGERAHAHPRRGDEQRRHAHRGGHPGGDGQSDARQDEFRHRPPPFHHQECRSHPRDEGRQRDRAGHARGAARTERILRFPLQFAVCRGVTRRRAHPCARLSYCRGLPHRIETWKSRKGRRA